MKVILLDFDDTILATYESRVPCLVEAFSYFGKPVSVFEIRRIWGAPFNEMITTLAPDVDFDTFYLYYRSVMARYKPKLHDGVLEFLKFLLKKHTPIFIISSSSRKLIEQDLL